MAAITTGPEFDLTALRAHLAANLPDYARPLFVRECETIDTTGTFKPMKGRLARDGYARAASPDSIWFDDHERGAFIACDDELRASIEAERIRL
jgi:fatty-acyl-CoA synthase